MKGDRSQEEYWRDVREVEDRQRSLLMLNKKGKNRMMQKWQGGCRTGRRRGRRGRER